MMRIFIERKLQKILKNLQSYVENSVEEIYEETFLKNTYVNKRKKSALKSPFNSQADRRIPYQSSLTGEANFANPLARSGTYTRSSLVRDDRMLI